MTGSGATTRRERAVDSRALDVLVEVLSQGEAESARDDFYGRLCEATCRLANLDRVIIFRYDPALRRVRASGAHGVDLALFARSHLTLESAPIAGRALQEDRVIELAGEVTDQVPPEYASLVAEPTRLVCVPMGAAGIKVGVILADRPLSAPPLEDGERDTLWTLAKAAALAIAARTAATQSEKAHQLESRIDLAREIHDGVVQRLFGVSLALDGPGALSAAARRRCARETQDALADLQRALQRPLSREPRSTRTTFVDEVERLATAYPELGVRLLPNDARVPEHLEPLCQSVLAEAVRNAQKHAAPSRVEIGLARDAGSLLLEITNDGVTGAIRRAGLGLRLAALEALHHGGVLEFGQTEPGSWRVRLVAPADG